MTSISIAEAEKFIRDKMSPFQLLEKHMLYLIDGLIGPSLRGIDTHGISLLPTYLKALEGGRCKPRPNLKFSGIMPAAIKLDADQALGIVAGYEAVFRSIEIATNTGISIVSVSNSSHFGAASNYTLAAAKKGFLCLCVSNSDSLMAPHKGLNKLFGTNPISFSAPADNGEFYCLDMATSQISFSKFKKCLENGVPIEKGWAACPSRGGESPLLPLGGYKGQGLAMFVSILSGVLNDGPLDHELSHVYSEPYDTAHEVGHSFITINIEAFVRLTTFKKRLSGFLDVVRSSQSIDGSPIIVPGDLESHSCKNRINAGIPLSPADAEFYLC